MAGQARVTIARAAELERDGWLVVFKAIPNVVHSGVVPITTGGGTKQRYPDILSVSGQRVLLSEVEQWLTGSVATEIAARLASHVKALTDPEVYARYRKRINEFRGILLPPNPVFLRELVLCNPPKSDAREQISLLRAKGVEVVVQKT